MRIKTLRWFALVSLPFLMLIDSRSLGSNQAPKVAVVVENIERIGQNEARWLVKVTNISGKPVFSTGINMKPWYHTLDYYLEQKLGKEDWQVVAPCKDTEPPSVIQLKPAVPMVQELTLKVPLSRICKKRDIELEGQFRIRVDYLESRVQARRYREMFFEDRKDKPRPAPAFSEPFEIPPFREPPEARPNR